MEWRLIEEFDTSDPVVAGLVDNDFAEMVEAFLATGQGRRGPRRGEAPSVLVEARAICAFTVNWLEANAPRP